MGTKSILVHLDDSKACGNRLQGAIAMAERHGAHLTGIYVIPDVRVPAYVEAQISAEVLEAQSNMLKEQALNSEKMFNAAVEASSLGGGEWRATKGDAPDVIAQHGRYADLVIAGQHDPDSDFMAMSHDMPDRLILSAGRPVLVLPNIFDGGAVGNRVMIAWDGSRTAGRAVHDALSILRDADEVSIMVANPSKTDNPHHEAPGTDLAAHLARHGIKAEADHVINSDVGVGDLLLSRAADKGTDLIVAGAYGHARWKELVLGGVTQHLLENMPVPVLMSH